jgi:tRNA threonylcarbamoyl adenosine modification protein YjeE
MQKLIKNQLEMRQLAEGLARDYQNDYKGGNIFALRGTLGAGKTFFAGAFINALCGGGAEVVSPTFNLLSSYETSKGLVHHFDLYRLKNVDELEEVGFFDCLKNGICLIEWPEIAVDFLPKGHAQVIIEVKNNDERLVTVVGG